MWISNAEELSYTTISLWKNKDICIQESELVLATLKGGTYRNYTFKKFQNVSRHLNSVWTLRTIFERLLLEPFGGNVIAVNVREKNFFDITWNIAEAAF